MANQQKPTQMPGQNNGLNQDQEKNFGGNQGVNTGRDQVKPGQQNSNTGISSPDRSSPARK